MMRYLLVAAATALLPALPAGSELVYVGSAGCDGDDTGCKNDLASQKVLRAVEVTSNGTMSPVVGYHQDEVGSPAWLAVTSDDRCFFSVIVDKDQIAAFSVGEDGMLLPAGVTPSGGINPAHASVSLDNHYLLVANYEGPDNITANHGASVASFRIQEGCSLELRDVKQHSGHSVNPVRQAAAHVHSAYAFRNGLIYSCDLGLDVIFVYNLGANGTLEELHRISTPPGVGPRHMAIHPTLPVIFVVCEMGEVVLTYQIQDGGSLTLLQSRTVVSAHTSGEGSKAAEIAVHPRGLAVYATNRNKENTITVFRTDHPAATLTQIQQVEAPGFPRGMTLLDNGILLVAGQSVSELWTYTVGEDGRLTDTGHRLHKGQGVPANPAAFAALHVASQIQI